MQEKNYLNKVFTIPNILSLIRLCLIPVIVVQYVVLQQYIVAAIITVISGLTDVLDGFIARKYNMVTMLGKFLDPIADKVLVSTALILICASIQVASKEIFSVVIAVCVAIILARELIVSGFRIVAASSGLVLAADKLGKIKTVLQDAAILVLAVSLGIEIDVVFYVGFGLLCAATLLTIISGINYFIKNVSAFKETK